MGRKTRREKVRETVDQVAQTRDRQQHAQNSRHEGRPENEVADQEVIGPEKYHADVVSLSIQFEKHERQRHANSNITMNIYTHAVSGKSDIGVGGHSGVLRRSSKAS